jgi:hypothetical protein
MRRGARTSGGHKFCPVFAAVAIDSRELIQGWALEAATIGARVSALGDLGFRTLAVGDKSTAPLVLKV